MIILSSKKTPYGLFPYRSDFSIAASSHLRSSWPSKSAIKSWSSDLEINQSCTGASAEQSWASCFPTRQEQVMDLLQVNRCFSSFEEVKELVENLRKTGLLVRVDSFCTVEHHNKLVIFHFCFPKNKACHFKYTCVDRPSSKWLIANGSILSSGSWQMYFLSRSTTVTSTTRLCFPPKVLATWDKTTKLLGLDKPKMAVS